MILNELFYTGSDVVEIARLLIGKELTTNFNGILTSGFITETEAYNGIIDKASHAYGGKKTARTEIMYHKGGTAYVYLCYGIHSLFNVVTNIEGIPHAVLIRSIQPQKGITEMEKRRRKKANTPKFTTGPGTVSEALGIHYKHSGISLLEKEIYIEDKGIKIPSVSIEVSSRIGVNYAAEDALLPYRFSVKNIIL